MTMTCDDVELDELRRLQIEKSSRKKSFALDQQRELIKKMLDKDISIPFMNQYLHIKCSICVDDRTLRSFVIRNFGREFYESYLQRNGWHKTKNSKVNVREAVNIEQKTAQTLDKTSRLIEMTQRQLSSAAEQNNPFSKMKDKQS